MTIYGDLEISTIDEMPPGRGEIITHLLTGDKLGEAIAFLREQLSDGRQAYIIYPLIDESEKLEAKAAAKEFEILAGTVATVSLRNCYMDESLHPTSSRSCKGSVPERRGR